MIKQLGWCAAYNEKSKNIRDVTISQLIKSLSDRYMIGNKCNDLLAVKVIFKEKWQK